jgi:hypothetical protein
MDIQALGKSDPEKIFLHIKNVAGATITANMAVCLCCDANSVDGISVVQPYTAGLKGWVGIADKDIADAGYGRVQSWGYRDSVLISHEGTSITITIGDALVAINGKWGCNTSGGVNLSTLTDASAHNLSKYIIAASTVPNTLSAATYVKGIIRCL